MFQNGYWNDLDNLCEDDPNANWGFLQNEDLIDRDESYQFGPYNYLHGLCDAFAQELHERYGYDIEYLLEREDDSDDSAVALIHAYCVTKIDDKPIYIDVRGMQEDYDSFICEFDVLERDVRDGYFYTTLTDKALKQYSFNKESEYRKEARLIMDEHPDYYKCA